MSSSDAPTPPAPSPSQLVLPLDDFATDPSGSGIARKKRVFCNRNLKLSGIRWIGFDMDYTLAIYNQAAMDELSIRCTIDKLVERGYPEFIRSVDVSTEFPVRGLLIDKRYGHVLKMDRYKYVHRGYHGMRELSKEELKTLYHSKKVRPATARYHWIDTLYALSEVATYAALVDAMESGGYAIDYARLFTDIREGIDEAHRDGTIPDAVAADLPRYVNKDHGLASTLHKMRSAGKRLFLLTNSRWPYSEKMMTYLLDGAMSEYPSWRHYFDVVICAAMKPSFFQKKNPLLQHDGAAVRPASFPLERGKIYEGGNLADLERALGVNGDEVLYVGDHIYGDILRSKKESAWRTVMIMQELEKELDAYEECATDFRRIDGLEEMREQLEDDLRFYQARFKDVSRRIDGGSERSRKAELEAERMRIKRAVERVRGRLREVGTELRSIERRVDRRFHGYWGSLLKQSGEQASFGKQVEDYACLYTSRVSNFFHYSPQQHFRSPRDVMAHEMGL